MKLNIEKIATLKVKILQGSHKGETITLEASMNDLLMGGSIADLLFDQDIFESIGHPFEYYTLLSIEY